MSDTAFEEEGLELLAGILSGEDKDLAGKDLVKLSFDDKQELSELVAERIGKVGTGRKALKEKLILLSSQAQGIFPTLTSVIKNKYRLLEDEVAEEQPEDLADKVAEINRAEKEELEKAAKVKSTVKLAKEAGIQYFRLLKKHRESFETLTKNQTDIIDLEEKRDLQRVKVGKLEKIFRKATKQARQNFMSSLKYLVDLEPGEGIGRDFLKAEAKDLEMKVSDYGKLWVKQDANYGMMDQVSKKLMETRKTLRIQGLTLFERQQNLDNLASSMDRKIDESHSLVSKSEEYLRDAENIRSAFIAFLKIGIRDFPYYARLSTEITKKVLRKGQGAMLYEEVEKPVVKAEPKKLNHIKPRVFAEDKILLTKEYLKIAENEETLTELIHEFKKPYHPFVHLTGRELQKFEDFEAIAESQVEFHDELWLTTFAPEFITPYAKLIPVPEAIKPGMDFGVFDLFRACIYLNIQSSVKDKTGNFLFDKMVMTYKDGRKRNMWVEFFRKVEKGLNKDIYIKNRRETTDCFKEIIKAVDDFQFDGKQPYGAFEHATRTYILYVEFDKRASIADIHPRGDNRLENEVAQINRNREVYKKSLAQLALDVYSQKRLLKT